MTRLRNVTRRSTNASTSTNPMTYGARAFMSSLKSVVPAVSPVTAAWTPGTAPIVCGTTCRRSVARACCEVRSVPEPASGIMISTTWRLTWRMVTGWRISPLARAVVRSCSMP